MAPTHAPRDAARLSPPQPSPPAARRSPEQSVSARQGGFALPALPSSVSRARDHVCRQLRTWGFPDDVGHTAQLVISEFFTNAVQHTESTSITCSLRLGERQLRIEVSDEGESAAGPCPRVAAPDAVDGRGLQLVGALADAWGVASAEHRAGRMVWAELSLRPA
ncbi:ATP-binding protein [Streptomyces sp. AJS327]|uniref:ATP-binding protein n=1 Tax=Streptomyces sp. AJS327 TaxID=2545265 RepID=UPI0015DDDBBB|nr:ATP-binding protein [Streptomyces sp. AJS327]